MTTKRRLGPTQTKMRARWVLELLDTTDGQAKETLCARDPKTGDIVGYCCLGIAQRLLAPPVAGAGGDGLGPHPPGPPPVERGDDVGQTAATWNDENEWDFAEIARMVAWITAQGHAAFTDVMSRDESGDINVDWADVVVPDDFDERAWARGVLDA
jgi:hypothetical protein